MTKAQTFDFKKLNKIEIKEVEKFTGGRVGTDDLDLVEFAYAAYYVWNKRSNPEMTKDEVDLLPYEAVEAMISDPKE